MRRFLKAGSFTNVRLSRKTPKRAIDLLLPYHIMMNGFEDGRVTTVAFAPGQHYHIADRALVEVRYGEEAMYAAAERGIMKLYLAEDGYDGRSRITRIHQGGARGRPESPSAFAVNPVFAGQY